MKIKKQARIIVLMICQVVGANWSFNAFAGEAKLANAVERAQEFTWDESKRIKAKIGKLQANRIAFEGDKISEVIGRNTEFSSVSSKNGQIFVTPTVEAGNINLTIVTDSGRAQDLDLKIEDKASTIILHESYREHKKQAKQREEFVNLEQNKILELIHLLESSSSYESKKDEVILGCNVRKKSRGSLGRYHGDFFEIVNNTLEEINIDPKLLNTQPNKTKRIARVIATAIDKKVLLSSESAKIWVVYYE